MKKGHLNPADRNLGECWMKKQNYNHWLNDLENITRCFLVLFFLIHRGKKALLSSLSGFFSSSLFVFNQSVLWLSLNFSRSLSLCFFDFFFLCWLLASCGWAQLESHWVGWRLLTLGSCSLVSETGVSEVLDSLCIRGKELWLPGKPFWLSVWLSVLWNSVFVWKLGLREGVASLCPPLLFKSPFTAGCCCNLWSVSFCLLAASLSCESKGTGRF